MAKQSARKQHKDVYGDKVSQVTRLNTTARRDKRKEYKQSDGRDTRQ
jgi:hypothetical protein